MVFITFIAIFAVFGLLIFLADKISEWHYNLNPHEYILPKLEFTYFAAAVIIWFAFIFQLIATYGNYTNVIR